MQRQWHDHNRTVVWQPASALGACALAALPKCPFCLLALAAMLGLESLPLITWLPRVFPLILIAAVLPLARGARQRSAVGPLLVGAAAAAMLFAGWIGVLSVWSMRVGAAGFVIASLWRARCGASCAAAICPGETHSVTPRARHIMEVSDGIHTGAARSHRGISRAGRNPTRPTHTP